MIRENKLTERTFKGFLWTLTGSGIQVILKIGVLSVLARLITPREFGIVSIALIAIEFSKMFTQMGVGPAIVQRKDLESTHLATGFTLSLLMGVLFSGVLVLIAPSLAIFFNMPELISALRVISLVFLVDSFTLIGQALMQRNMKYKTAALIEVISFAAGYGVVGLFLAYLGWGMWALVIANLAQALLHAIFVIAVQPFPKRPGFEFKAFKELIIFGGGFTLARIANYIALQGDNLVVGKMLGAGPLGIYGRAYQFMVMPAALFGNALDKALFPAMAKVQDDKQRLGTAYLSGISFIALVGIPLSVILMLLAPEIITVLLGNKWSEVILPFQILACGLVFRMSYKISDTLVRATGAVYRRAWRQVIYALMVVVGSYIGQFWGLYGVAGGVAIALVINFLLMGQLSIQLTCVTWSDIFKAHFSGMFLGISVGLISVIIVRICRLNSAGSLSTLVITAMAIMIVLFLEIRYFPNFFMREDQNKLLTKLLIKHFKRLPA